MCSTEFNYDFDEDEVENETVEETPINVTEEFAIPVRQEEFAEVE